MQFANQTLYYSGALPSTGAASASSTRPWAVLTAIAAVEQPDARVLVVADQRVRDEWSRRVRRGSPRWTRFELCRRRGGRYALAESLDDFAYLGGLGLRAR